MWNCWLEWWFFLIINAVVICNVLLLSILSPLAGLAALGAKFCANYNLANKFSNARQIGNFLRNDIASKLIETIE